MLTRIDFAFGAPDRLGMACEVVHKHYMAGRRLVVYTRDKQRLSHFDRLLWGFDPTAFIPHVMSADPLASQTAIVFTSDSPALAIPDASQASAWLINLDLDCPPAPENFPRILEIVGDHADDKAAARERWRQYKASGYDLHAHDVSKKP